MSTTSLPSLNAALNATSALCIVAGLWAIRAKLIPAHIRCMLGACAASTAFLVFYLIYHAQVGSVHFTGIGWVRPVYFAILITHTVLAIVIVPLVIRTVWLAAKRRWIEHVRMARWTVPLWLYVSVTGIIVYWMLYRMPGGRA